MDNIRFTFSKKEKLCSRKVIASLFEKGKSLHSGPFRLVWMESSDKLPCPVAVAISVGKKSMPAAVNRNRVKRLVREAWRLNKHKLYGQLEKMNIQLYIMLIYTGDKIPEYASLEGQVEKLLGKFSLHLSTARQK